MSAPTSVRPVEGRAAFRRFIDYMYERNAADPHWVPPLRISEHERLTPKKNPFFAHADVDLLMAWRGGRAVGRIAAIDDRRHNETHGDNAAMFGFFEAEDAEAAHALLGAVEAWARTRGRARVRGPLNPSLNESAGLLIEGFDADPMVMMPHNPPEYASFIESAGYAKVKDLFAWLYEFAEMPPAFLKYAARARRSKSMTIRPFKLSEFTKEVERLRTIYCAAWARNWGFVAPTEAEFRRIAAELKPIFDARAAVCAEVDGRTIACLVAVPDINQALKGTSGRLLSMAVPRILLRKRYVSQVRLLLLGIDEGYRRSGLFPLLLAEWHRQLLGTEIRRAEFSWVLEDNAAINRPAELSGARRYKTYRIYEKALG